jgi:hypothetical protein
LERFTYKLNSCLPNLFSYIDVKTGVNRKKKDEICSLIYDKILLGNKPLPKNLIFINTNQIDISLNLNIDESLQNHNMSIASELRAAEDIVNNIPATSEPETERNALLNKSVIENIVIKSPETVNSNFLYPRLSQMSLN